MRPADDPKPFLPRQRAEDEFPPGLHIPVADLPDVEGLVDLLERAGMEPLTWRALVTDFLMPRLTDLDLDEAERRDALATVRSYFDSIRGEGAGDREIRDAVRETLLPVRETQGRRTALSSSPRTTSTSGPTGCRVPNWRRFMVHLDLPSFWPSTRRTPKTDLSFYEWMGVQVSSGGRRVRPLRRSKFLAIRQRLQHRRAFARRATPRVRG